MNMRGINNLVPQSRYLQNLSYFRLKDITLGYTLPSNFTERYRIEKLRVYFAAYNVWEKTGSFIPVDPESSVNGHGSYTFYGTSIPQSRSFSFGLQITL